MDVKIYGFESFQRPAVAGDLVSAVLADRPVIGLKGRDQSGDYILVLKGSDEPAPVIIDLDQFGSSVAVIEGAVTIEPLYAPTAFAQARVLAKHPGALLIGSDASLGISVLYRQSIGRKEVFRYDLTTGQPWPSDMEAVGYAEWRMLVTQPGRKDPFEVARFPD